MKIAYVVDPDFTALDLVGPYEVISRWPDAEVHFLARSLEPVRCDRGLTVIPTAVATRSRIRSEAGAGEVDRRFNGLKGPGGEVAP